MGHSTADFLVCTSCGVYVGAHMEHEGRSLSVTNINALEDRDKFENGVPVSYEDETTESRLERRDQRWTPARLEVADSVF